MNKGLTSWQVYRNFMDNSPLFGWSLVFRLLWTSVQWFRQLADLPELYGHWFHQLVDPEFFWQFFTSWLEPVHYRKWFRQLWPSWNFMYNRSTTWLGFTWNLLKMVPPGSWSTRALCKMVPPTGWYTWTLWTVPAPSVFFLNSTDNGSTRWLVGILKLYWQWFHSLAALPELEDLLAGLLELHGKKFQQLVGLLEHYRQRFNQPAGISELFYWPLFHQL